MNKTITLIPARMASSRLPGKPLALIKGKPMIIHVMERALEADLGPVIVACCGQEIADIVTRHGGQVIQTTPALPSGTDRIHEALQIIDPNKEYNTIINLQGDLPFVNPFDIRLTLDLLKNKNVDIATLATEIKDAAEVTNPHVVKIAMSNPQQISNTLESARAIYFSRQPIPANATRFYHHIGIYTYRRVALERFVSLPPSHLEEVEKIESLRALEDGMRVDVALVKQIPQSVDTPEDLLKLMV